MKRSLTVVASAFAVLLALGLVACGSKTSASRVSEITDDDRISMVPVNTIISFKQPMNLKPGTFKYIVSNGSIVNRCVDAWVEFEPHEQDRSIPSSTTFKIIDKEQRGRLVVFTIESEKSGYLMRLNAGSYSDELHCSRRSTIGDYRRYLNITLPSPLIIE